jgi:hypothetical protein
MNVVVDKTNDATGDANSQGRDEVVKAWQEIGMPLFYIMLIAMAVSAILLIASGVGYLQQKKVLGRGCGNTYAIVSIVVSVAMGVMVTEKAGGGFNIGTIIGLIYPVLTLILLNGTFKHDFVR